MTIPLPSPAAPRGARPWPLRVLAVLGAWLGLQVLLLALAFAWVAVYSYGVDPGHDAAYYEAYAQRAVPYVAMTASVPLFLAFGWVCARRAGAAGAAFARTTALVFVVADAVVLVSAGAWLIWIVASALKVGAVLGGGRLAARAAGARA